MDNSNNETTTETTAAATTPRYRGAMATAMQYISSAERIRATPSELASAAAVPGMTAYRAMRTAVAQGIMRVEKSAIGERKRGPKCNVFIKG